MKYVSNLLYEIIEDDKAKPERERIPIGVFRVDGGAKRFISMNSPDDDNIVSEMEQATAFKNITLYLPPTKDGKDMQVALSLTEVALNNKLSLHMQIQVDKHSGGKKIETFFLDISKATLIKRPYIVTLENRPMLKVERRFSVVRWGHGKLNNKNKMIFEDM